MKKYLLLSFLFIFSLTLSYFNIAQAATLAERLKGRILLQVESYGEAWYVNPLENKRIYLRDGDIAYSVMSQLGLGITNANLKKIPIGIENRFSCTDNDSDGLCNKLEVSLGTDINDADTDNDGFLDGTEVKGNYDPLSTSKTKLSIDTSLVNRLKGRVLLQVQVNGEAWYLNPVDGKRYYMPDGPSAYQIMRFLSLGITNANLNNIPISSFSVSPPIVPPSNDTQAPTTPTNLTATASATQITLNWTVSADNVGVSQYLIERSTSATTGFTQITSVTTNSYLNTGLSANTTYYFRVRATDAAGNLSGYSGIANARTTQIVVDTQSPTAPTNLVATASSTQITLNWTNSTDNIGVTQYAVERSLSASTGFSHIATTTTNTYLNTSLNANTTYYFRVRASDAVGNLSGYSGIANARTGQIVVDTQSPTVPINLTAVASSTQINLTWASSTDNIAVTQYQIERSVSSPNNFLPLTTITTNSYINDHLNSRTTYYYRVRAADAAGNLSAYSIVVSATTGIISLIDSQDPTIPANLAVVVSGTQASLSWASSTDNIAVTQYSLERSTSINFNVVHTINLISISYIDTGLTPNTTYYYRVYAADAANNFSDYSNVVSAVIENNYIISQALGEDYSLPANISANNFSGYVCSNCSNASTTFIWTNWRAIESQNTSPRTYSWTNIDNQLATAAANGKKVSIMIHSTVAGGINEISAVPDWVYTEFNLPPYDQLVNMGGTSQIRIIPSWRPEIRARFEEFIAAFGARYKNNNTIESIYITAVSHASGEELWISRPQLTTLERDWGLTPQVLQTWLESRMSAWLQAFSGEERKLVWVGSATGLSWNDRPDFELVARNLIDYAAANNIGGRAGLVECYLDKVGDYLWSNYKDGNGYLYVNEDSARFDGRYWGDENEEYGPSFTRFGVDHSSPVRYRFAIMRSLQARMRFLWTTPFTETINPALSNYARLSFGKNVNDSPDAWSFLFQSPQLGPTPIKNFERWLIQRDLPGGMTVPTQRVNRVFDAGGAYASSTLWYDYTARRTDFASNNNYMYFALDDRFVANGTVQIKVEIIDNSQTSWHLDYYNSNGSLVSTSNITNNNDGQKKTYTFTLNNPVFNNQFSNMDFRLVNVGPGDLTASWVRLVRSIAP